MNPKKNKSKLPKGWDEARVKRVLDHYDNQSDTDAVKEYEAAMNDTTVTYMPIPRALLPKVRKLLAKKI